MEKYSCVIKEKINIKMILNNGKRVEGRYFILLYSPNKGDYGRFRIIMRKKFGKAVERNHVKRLIREALSSRLKDLINGIDCLIIPRKGLHNVSAIDFSHVVADLSFCFEQVKR